MDWMPVLADDDAIRAEEHVRRIAESLMPILAKQREGGIEPPYLLAEIAVFFHYASCVLDHEEYAKAAAAFLDEAVCALPHWPSRPSLFGGYCTVAWAADVIAPDHDGADTNAEVDQSILDLLGTSPWSGEFDLIGGLTGYATYFCKRLHRSSAAHGAKLVIRRLDEVKHEVVGGVTWHTSASLLPQWQRDLCPAGYYNTGVAHGTPGVLPILANALAHDIEPEICERLLHGAVAWLLSIKQDRELVGSHFPSWWTPRARPMPSRHAWCYGDPGVAAMLLYAGIVLSEDSWCSEAISILRDSLSVPTTDGGIRDAGLCHGASGLAHLYNRVFQSTGIATFRDASVTWFRRSFRCRGKGGFGGYQAYNPGGFGGPKMANADPWDNDPGFLIGSCGIGLAYLSGLTTVEPAWDGRMLLDLPRGAT